MTQPTKFTDLSAVRQNQLIAHFMSEFDMNWTDARNDCLKLEGEDFQLHLQACEAGYAP